MYGGEKKEIGEAVNRGPCICHLLGSIVTPPFFPHNDAPFRHNYRHYSWRAFYRRHDTMGRYLYTLRFGLQPRWNMCIHLHARAHTYTRSSTSKFFEYCADPERKSSSFASILLCVLTPRFRVANTFERSLRTRTDLIRASFSSSLRKYWTLELALVSYYPPVCNRIWSDRI